MDESGDGVVSENDVTVDDTDVPSTSTPTESRPPRPAVNSAEFKKRLAQMKLASDRRAVTWTGSFRGKNPPYEPGNRPRQDWEPPLQQKKRRKK